MTETTRRWIAGAVIAFCVAIGVDGSQVANVMQTTDRSDRPRVVEQTSTVDASIEEEAVRDGLGAAGFIEIPENVTATLSTLEKLDDYPVYTMRYLGSYIRASELEREIEGNTGQANKSTSSSGWSCSLLAAAADSEQAVLGRNFDWEYSPILVLFLEPEEGYRSVMSIDIGYLIEPEWIDRLDEAPVEQLLPLLSAPFLTFDGMNEKGVAIGMASVDYECNYPSDPSKRDVGDLQLMRELLEASATVDEAITFLEGVNPASQGGPNTHYLIADRTSAALIEYHNGEMYVFRSSVEAPWQLGTNFPVILTEGSPGGHCWRYDQIEATLREYGGALTVDEAGDLLQAVSTPMTRWSIVYDLANLQMHLTIERNTETVHVFSLGDRRD